MAKPDTDRKETAMNAPTPGTSGGDTAAQLRQDITDGRTGDKVAAPDPAAVPLGVDEEAAGTPPDAHQIREARAREARSAAAAPTSAAIDTKPSEKRGKYMVLATIALVAVGLLAAFVVIALRG